MGQAGICVESNGSKLVCDPWFSDTGGFLARWHQFPSNENISIKDLKDCDFLYISHEHHDHFDREFLKSFPKDVQVIIANYQTKDFRDDILELGFSNVIEISNAYLPDFLS